MQEVRKELARLLLENLKQASPRTKCQRRVAEIVTTVGGAQEKNNSPEHKPPWSIYMRLEGARDDAKALSSQLFLPIAELDYSESQYQLGNCCEHGHRRSRIRLCRSYSLGSSLIF